MVTEPSGWQDKGANTQLISITLKVIFTDLYEIIGEISTTLFQQLVYSSWSGLAFYAGLKDFGSAITFSNKSLDRNQTNQSKLLSHLCTRLPLISLSLLGIQSPIFLSPVCATNYARKRLEIMFTCLYFLFMILTLWEIKALCCLMRWYIYTCLLPTSPTDEEGA